jgi:hypothetical protein
MLTGNDGTATGQKHLCEICDGNAATGPENTPVKSR